MNGWDLFTWFNCAVLAGTAIVIFGFFLKEARGILAGNRIDVDDGPVDVLLDTTDPVPFLEGSVTTPEVPDRT